MDFTSYTAAPITEAVVELKFAETINDATKKKISDALEDIYPLVEQQVTNDIELAVVVKPADKAAPGANLGVRSNQSTSFRRSNLDQDAICIVGSNVMIVSQLAPYPGGDMFFDRVKRSFNFIASQIGYFKPVRLGVRFINRLDIPKEPAPTQIEDYLKVYMEAPEELGPMNAYVGRAQFQLPKLGGQMIVHTASAGSPLPGHFALMLDIDIGIMERVPNEIDGIANLLDAIRIEKNRAFEACITKATRERIAK